MSSSARQPLGDIRGVRTESRQGGFQGDECVDIAAAVGNMLAQFDQVTYAHTLVPVAVAFVDRAEGAHSRGKARVERVDDASRRLPDDLRHRFEHDAVSRPGRQRIKPIRKRCVLRLRELADEGRERSGGGVVDVCGFAIGAVGARERPVRGCEKSQQPISRHFRVRLGNVAGDDLQHRRKVVAEALHPLPADRSAGSFQPRKALVDDRRDRVRPSGRGEGGHDELLEWPVALGLVEQEISQPFGASLTSDSLFSVDDRATTNVLVSRRCGADADCAANRAATRLSQFAAADARLQRAGRRGRRAPVAVTARERPAPRLSAPAS